MQLVHNITRRSSPVTWSLFRPAPSPTIIFQDMEDLFDRAVRSPISRLGSPLSGDGDLPLLSAGSFARPYRASVYDDEKKFQFKLEVPGIKPADMKVRLEQDSRVLRIKGTRNEKHGSVWYQANFEEALALDETVDTSLVTAHLADGILTVNAPKNPVVEPVTVDIPIQTEPLSSKSLPAGDNSNESSRIGVSGLPKTKLASPEAEEMRAMTDLNETIGSNDDKTKENIEDEEH